MIRILNLYSGLGGNRALWDQVGKIKVTAVEIVPEIAEEYGTLYPNDEVIVGDAHEFLLEHYAEYDFIWASPPCPTHSRARYMGVLKGQVKAKYPDMRLYQEIILLKHYAPIKTRWVVENVIPYYEPLIKPIAKIGRHLFWANFHIPEIAVKTDYIEKGHPEILIRTKGLPETYVRAFKRLKEKGMRSDQLRTVARDLVRPDIGLHILRAALSSNTITEYVSLKQS